MRKVLGIVVSAGLASTAASADFVSLSASRDAAIYESPDGSLANGAGRYLFAGKNNQNRARRSLVRFDFAGAVPEGATITSVRLELNLSQGAGGASSVSLHRALAGWSAGASDPEDPEGSGTVAGAGDATWLFSSADGNGGGAAWQNAGGDFAGAASATTLTSAVGVYAWSSELLLQDVLGFLADPAANHGWFILGDESTIGSARRFDSSEGGALGGIGPRLVIEYTQVPAPGAMALLTCLGFMHRRRR
ncbi:MAG: hypothetical protein RL325_1350 [Planctomycetota bacterium]